MKKIFKIYLIIIIPLFISCEDSINIEEQRIIIPQPGLIKPLGIGCEWIYTINRYGEDGKLISVGDELHTIARTELINGEEWFVEESDTTPTKTSVRYKNRSDGLWISEGTDLFSKDTPYLLVPYPVRIKNEFIVGRISDAGNNIFNIYRINLDVNIKITVPAGTFRCIKYIDVLKAGDGTVIISPRNVIYYSPNVGLVKSEFYALDENNKLYLFQKQELKSFRLK